MNSSNKSDATDTRGKEQITNGEFSATEIAEILEQADLDSTCQPTSGHCTVVAMAIHDLFDIDGYYVAVEGPHQKYSRPAHVAVMKDGVIIDATGVVSEEYMKDYAIAGLKRDEIDKAQWGPANLGLFERTRDSLGEGRTQLLNNIKSEIRKIIDNE
jgi:hypothetical protein